MTLPIKITWSFVAQVVRAAIVSGIDKKGEPELLKQIEAMGRSADLAVEMLEVLQDILAYNDSGKKPILPDDKMVWLREVVTKATGVRSEKR